MNQSRIRRALSVAAFSAACCRTRRHEIMSSNICQLSDVIAFIFVPCTRTFRNLYRAERDRAKERERDGPRCFRDLCVRYRACLASERFKRKRILKRRCLERRLLSIADSAVYERDRRSIRSVKLSHPPDGIKTAADKFDCRVRSGVNAGIPLIGNSWRPWCDRDCLAALASFGSVHGYARAADVNASAISFSFSFSFCPSVFLLRGHN